jgi:hypothetical protein
VITGQPDRLRPDVLVVPARHRAILPKTGRRYETRGGSCGSRPGSGPPRHPSCTPAGHGAGQPHHHHRQRLPGHRVSHGLCSGQTSSLARASRWVVEASMRWPSNSFEPLTSWAD